MSFILPLEIEETILDFLAEDVEGHSALKTCSLVCQAFLPICRKHVLRSIVLNQGDFEASPPYIFAFERLLRETPEIADYIRKLDYKIQPGDLTSPSIHESLKRISRLEFLTLRNNWLKGPRLYWSNSPIRPVLLHLLHLPTLTYFEIHIDKFVVSDLIPCVNLKYLYINDLTNVAAENTFSADFPEHSIQLKEFVAGNSASTMKLCTAQRPDGKPIIDFGSLSKIIVNLANLNDRASQELFRRCHALTTAHIYYLQYARPKLADMLRPSMQTPKHIALNIFVDDLDFGDSDPLSGFPSQLEAMHTRNIIETVAISILVNTDEYCYRGDEWSRLDEVLTTPVWFSLKRVAIEINCYGNGGYELEMALQDLPETHFPRLSSSNSVSFDFEVFTCGY